MGLRRYFDTAAHREERAQLPLLTELIARFRHEVPFSGHSIVFAHLLVRNSMVMVEALHAGGAEVVLSEAHHSPAVQPVRAALAQAGVDVLPVAQAVQRGELYLDVAAVLGRARPPRGAAEVTRTGVLHYEKMDVPVVSADDCRSKLIEGFFGTGDSLRRAWAQLRPKDPLRDKFIVQFGYGKIGRGVAWRTREAGNQVLVLDPAQTARQRADQDGFQARTPEATPATQRLLERADVIVAVAGVPGGVGRTLPVEWFKQGAVLVNLGAEDEFGPEIEEELILGGRGQPLNFHLARPTANRYVDAPLSAHLLALEALLDP